MNKIEDSRLAQLITFATHLAHANECLVHPSWIQADPHETLMVLTELAELRQEKRGMQEMNKPASE